jgi:hypothetical protein
MRMNRDAARASPILTDDAGTALEAALCLRTGAAVDRAARALAVALDGSTAYVGGLRQVLWDALGRPDAHGGVLAAYEAANGAGAGVKRGALFLKRAREAIAGQLRGPSLAPLPQPSGSYISEDIVRRYWPRLTPRQRRGHLEAGTIAPALVAELARGMSAET